MIFLYIFILYFILNVLNKNLFEYFQKKIARKIYVVTIIYRNPPVLCVSEANQLLTTEGRRPKPIEKALNIYEYPSIDNQYVTKNN